MPGSRQTPSDGTAISIGNKISLILPPLAERAIFVGESYRPQLAEASLIVAGVDSSDGGTRIMRLTNHPFFYLTLFVPQGSSAPERPHPLITAYLAATERSITTAVP